MKLQREMILLVGLLTVASCDDDSESANGGGSGGDRSCTELCLEAQADSCTTIKGDCGAFCAAIESSQANAGCESEVATYIACQNASANVCDEPGCSSEENALVECFTPYCVSNSSDPDCATLIGSF